jgi:hypothetical protein
MSEMGQKEPPNHVSDGGSFRRKRLWHGHSEDRDKPAPTPPRLRLPANCRDVTAERIGTVIGIIGATACKGNEARMTDAA